MNQLRTWLRELIDEPQDITLRSLQEKQRSERKDARLDAYRTPLSPSLDPRRVPSPAGQKY